MATFSEVLDGVQVDGARHRAQIPDDWRQGRTGFGGLQVALALRAMRARVPELPLRVLQASFIAPVLGEVQIESTVLRSGKSVTQVDARLLQDGQVACTVQAVFGAARPSIFEFAAPVPRSLPRPEVSPPWPEGRRPRCTYHFNLHQAGGPLPFSGGEVPRMQTWVRLIDTVPIAEEQLVALADTIPSPALCMATEPLMASSLSWTLEFFDAVTPVPATTWHLLDAEATAAHGGYVSQSVTLSREDGTPLAYSRQVATIFG